MPITPFMSLVHPDRLKIIKHLIGKNPQSIPEIAQALNMPSPNVQSHVNVLFRNGFLERQAKSPAFSSSNYIYWHFKIKKEPLIKILSENLPLLQSILEDLESE